jgi:hypothetical protein
MSGCHVINVLENGKIWLDVGYAHMTHVGDEYEIYPAALLNSPRTHTPVNYRIDVVHAFHSEGEQLDPHCDTAEISESCAATLRKPFRAKSQVNLSPDVDGALESLVQNSHSH